MDTSSETGNIGNMLKTTREAKGVSLEDVSALLKIREDHLLALENNDFDRLPGDVYAIGFIRTYATHLGLNAGELISIFKETTMLLPVDEGNYNGTGGEPVSLGLKIGLGVFAVFLVYLMWLIAGGAGTSERDAQSESAPVEAEATRAAPVSPAAPSVAVEAAPSPTSANAGPAKTPVTPTAETPTKTTDNAPARAASVTAETAPEGEVGEPVQPVGTARNIEVADLAAPQGVGETATDASQPAVPRIVEVRASRRTWLRIENTQGTVLFSSIIRGGESFTLQEDTPYTLATRDAGALHFHVDDEKVGDVGRRGQILTARQIDRAGIIALQN